VREQDGVSRDRRDGGLQEVLAGLDADELGGFDQPIEQRGDFGPALGARAVMILAAKDQTAKRPFGGVVVQRNGRIIEKPLEARPQPEHVLDRFAEPALGEGLRVVVDRSSLDLLDDRSGFRMAERGELTGVPFWLCVQ